MVKPMKIHKNNLIIVATLVLVASVFAFNKSYIDSPADVSDTPPSEEPSTSQANQEVSQPTPIKQASSQINNPDAVIDTTKHNSKILAENPGSPEYEYYLMATTNDPQLSSSWHLNKIQTDRAWDLTTGSSDVVVAVIDSPFALAHEDLSSKWFTNSGETGNTQNGDTCWDGSAKDKSTNNCDDDANGYVDDWRGYDFINDDNNVQAGLTNPSGDAVDHGTLVAGTVAATANNSKGSVGVDQNTKIMPLQIFDDDGNATTTDVVAAVEYATANGANIINMSLGSNGSDSLLRTAIQDAVDNNVSVIASSGNCALNDEPLCYSLTSPGRMTWPALFPETIAVGATTSTDTRASFSSYGPMLDLSAPGVSVGPIPYFTSANQTTAYATASGTSFSAPIVAGIASLLISQDDTLTPAEIRDILSESAEKVDGMAGFSFLNTYGYGRANAHRATLMALAATETDAELGTDSLSPTQQAVGHVWRASSGNIEADESILMGCRIFATDTCSVTASYSSFISRFYQSRQNKGKEIQYIFIKGSDLSSGTWQLSIHNNDYASAIRSITK